MSKQKELQFMTNAEVSAALKVRATTTRTWIRRRALGQSCPEFPAPLGKVAGGWIWDRGEVKRFIAGKESI